MSTPSISFMRADTNEPTEAIEDPVFRATLDIYRSRGWTRVDKLGRVSPDDAPAKLAVYELFRDQVVIDNENDARDDGLSDEDLFSKIFPAVKIRIPLTDEDDDSEVKAYTTIKRKLWNYVLPKVGSFCQESAQLDNLDLIVIEKKVVRELRDLSTSTRAQRWVMVRFFTRNPEMIFMLSSQPATKRLIKAAEDTAKHLQMNTARHPELVTRVSRETQAALKQSQAALTTITRPSGADAAAE